MHHLLPSFKSTYEVMYMVCRLALLNLNFIKHLYFNRVLFSECY